LGVLTSVCLQNLYELLGNLTYPHVILHPA
jgi:hypothetical protein